MGYKHVSDNLKYKHHKGGDYVLIGVLHDSTNAREGAEVIAYLSLSTGKLCCRDASEFFEKVTWPDGIDRPRFTQASELEG